MCPFKSAGHLHGDSWVQSVCCACGDGAAGKRLLLPVGSHRWMLEWRRWGRRSSASQRLLFGFWIGIQDEIEAAHCGVSRACRVNLKENSPDSLGSLNGEQMSLLGPSAGTGFCLCSARAAAAAFLATLGFLSVQLNTGWQLLRNKPKCYHTADFHVLIFNA